MPTSPNDDARRVERDRLIEYQAHANDAYDQTLFKLSGGALGLSFVFVRQFVGAGQDAHMLYTLGFAWLLWIVSLMCVLGSFYVSGMAMDEAVRQIDEKSTVIVLPPSRQAASFSSPPFDGGRYAVMTRRLNAVGGITFVMAAVLAGLFIISNLGGFQMPNNETDSTTATTRSRPETRPFSEHVEERGRVPFRPQPNQTQTTGSGSGGGSGSGSGGGSGSGSGGGSGSGSSGSGSGSGRPAQR